MVECQEGVQGGCGTGGGRKWAWPLPVAYLYRGLPLRSASRPDRGHILASPDSAGRKGPDDEDLTHLCRNRPGGCFTHHQHERRRAALGRPARRLERSRLSWRSWPWLGPWLGAPRLSRVSRRLVRAALSAVPASSLARRLWLVRAAVLDRMALWVPRAYLPVTRGPAGGAAPAGCSWSGPLRRGIIAWSHDASRPADADRPANRNARCRPG